MCVEGQHAQYSDLWDTHIFFNMMYHPILYHIFVISRISFLYVECNGL